VKGKYSKNEGGKRNPTLKESVTSTIFIERTKSSKRNNQVKDGLGRKETPSPNNKTKGKKQKLLDQGFHGV